METTGGTNDNQWTTWINNHGTGTADYVDQYNFPRTCPNCRYCPTCGRPSSGYPYPTYPIWYFDSPISPQYQVYC